MARMLDKGPIWTRWRRGFDTAAIAKQLGALECDIAFTAARMIDDRYAMREAEAQRQAVTRLKRAISMRESARLERRKARPEGRKAENASYIRALEREMRLPRPAPYVARS